MTEAEWLKCINPTPMLEYLGLKASDLCLRQLNTKSGRIRGTVQPPRLKR
jgi:hypothetical protein